MADRYEPASFEAKWRERWKGADLFRTRFEPDAPKFYGLDFFPYPSGAGLSVGHARNYTPTDVICRMKRMQGFNVLHPMGFDAFGLPAENEAIKRQTHPAEMIDRYAARYREQMDLIGISFDWSRSFKSSDPEYYRWTQWIFELLYRRGLAYQKSASVNWDPVDMTVLADEEVIAGRAERSGALVEKKWIPQWFFRITAYAQRLLDDLETIDWPEGIKAMQRAWIGRSEGVEFAFRVDVPSSPDRVFDLDTDIDPVLPLEFEVFTTRIDTVFGVTFCVLSPEHPLVEQLPLSETDRAAVQAYQSQAKGLSEADRSADNREKTGVFTGAFAINPLNGERVPIWLADYVLMGYGTGAIMAVPGHDERDFAFAQKFGIPVRRVIAPAEDPLADDTNLPFVSKDGVLVNSGEYDGCTVEEAQAALGAWLEANGKGRQVVKYKLRDWLISRQRYWGCPIPVIHTKDGEIQLVPEKDLPVRLPEVDNYQPSGDGSSPLTRIPEYVNVTDLHGSLGQRETDTMGGFACSSWYFLRFCDPHNQEQAWSPEAVAKWMPVDCYVGGAEHAVMHLLYARFWTKVLYDEGLVPVKEPFQRLVNQGQVLGHTPYRRPRPGEHPEQGEDAILVRPDELDQIPADQLFYRWARMSKSKGNVVTPDDMVAQYGADALRLCLLFTAPFTADIEWKSDGVEAMAKFLSRVFRLAETLRPHYDSEWRLSIGGETSHPTVADVRRLTHQTIARCTEDIERFSFNTYVSWLMKYVNGLNDLWPANPDPEANLVFSEALETLVLLLAPGAPHSADELWESLGRSGFTLDAPWPRADSALAAETTVTIAVQVNGKLRDTFDLPADADQETVRRVALARPKISALVDGRAVKKTIVVPGKLVNVVLG
jgi:leucyl-tRNA synthetase